VGNDISIDSELSRSLKIVGSAFLILSFLTVFFGVSFDEFILLDKIFCGISIFLLFLSAAMITYKAKIIITHDQYSVRHTTLGMNITNRTDITGWKTIRLSARTHHSSGNTFSPRKFELDLSPSVGKEWTFGDVFISGHFQYAFDEDPAVVAGMLINLQKVTGFNVELDKSAEALFGITYRTLKTEARV